VPAAARVDRAPASRQSVWRSEEAPVEWPQSTGHGSASSTVVPSGVERERFQRTGHRPGRRAASRQVTAAMGRSEQMVSDSEETLLEINPAMFRNHPIGFILSVILIAAAGAGLVILAIWWLTTKAATLTVSNKRTIQRTRDVRNIEIDQSVFQRMFGVGSIGIASAGQSGIEIQFAGVRDPDGVKALIDRYRDL
jgi:hypothetical protein